MAHAGRSNWFYCKTHRVMWTIGYVFSSKHQSLEEQRQHWNDLGLEEFETVQAYLYPRNFDEEEQLVRNEIDANSMPV
jgi:hypothetical protein